MCDSGQRNLIVRSQKVSSSEQRQNNLSSSHLPPSNVAGNGKPLRRKRGLRQCMLSLSSSFSFLVPSTAWSFDTRFKFRIMKQPLVVLTISKLTVFQLTSYNFWHITYEISFAAGTDGLKMVISQFHMSCYPMEWKHWVANCEYVKKIHFVTPFVTKKFRKRAVVNTWE